MAQATFSQAFIIENGNGNMYVDGSPLEGNPTDWLEGSGQTFKKGDPVMFSGGYIVVATASSNEVGNLLGFAMVDASGTQGTKVQVRRIMDGDRIVMNFDPSSGSEVTAQTLVGSLTNFDIYTTGSVNYLTANNAAAARDKPYGVIEHLFTPDLYPSYGGDALGDTNGRVVVKVSSAYLQ